MLVRGTDPQAERLLRSGFLGAEPRSAACLACGRALALRAPAFLRETALGVSERALTAVEALDHARDAAGLEEVLANGGNEEARAAALRSLARTGRIAGPELAALAASAPSARLRQEARRALTPAVAEPAAELPRASDGAAQ